MTVNKTAIILSGGKSRRMGKDKATLQFRGMRLIDYAINVVAKLSSEVLISSNKSIALLNYAVINDIYSGKGPLAGLHACLKHSSNDVNLVIPCDAPFLTTELYEELLVNLRDADAIVPVLPDNKMEPLIAIYRRDCASKMEEQLIAGDYKVLNLLNKIKVKYYPVKNIEMFRNLNYPIDLNE